MKFSAKDRDLDTWSSDCSVRFASNSGWWFKACSTSNLNGHYITSNYEDARNSHNYPNGIFWDLWRGRYYSMMKTEMMIRPK